MKEYFCCMDFDSSWILSKRDDEILPVENIMQQIKKGYAPTDTEAGLSDCSFVVTVEDGVTRQELQQELIDLVRELYPDAASPGQFEVEVRAVASDKQPEKPSEDEPESDQQHEKEPKKAKEPAPKEEEPAEPAHQESAIDLIHDLVGAEQFKALADECVKLAPHLKDSDTVTSFIRRKYLIAVDEGCGLSRYLHLFAQLLQELELFIPDETKPVEEVTVEDEDSLSSALGVIRSKSRHRVISVDISALMTKTNTHKFRDFLRTVEEYAEYHIVFFRIPFVEPDVVKKIKNDLNDYLFIHELSILPFTMEQLSACATRILLKKNFEINRDGLVLFTQRIAEEKSDGRFYGFNTVEKVVSEMLYLKQRYNAENASFDKKIDAPHIAALVSAGTQKESVGLEALDEMIGMKFIKDKVLEIVGQIEMSLRNKKIEAPCIHMRFVGNPGTGKTTVARIVGTILRDKGVLRHGNFFEYGGRDFCGQYVGQTAPKTAAMCRDAYGSVLFIDEAYSLYRDDIGGRDYGMEAIETLIAEMENHRSDLLVIMAGYPDEMKTLMKANPGLESRLPYLIEFPNYTQDELADIFLVMAKKGFEVDEVLEEAVRNYFRALPDEVVQAKEFSNARFVRNLFERTWGKAALRSQLSGGMDACRLTAEDFEMATNEKDFQLTPVTKANRIGFN